MGNPDPLVPSPQPPDPNDGVWPYIGVGCVTFVSGLFGGGMIAVLVAKAVGAAQGCMPDKETGAPCNWFTFAMVGGMIGMIAFPTVATLLLRRGRKKNRNNV